ncbi:MAG TPA: DUF350 domain-containing protein [Candidatus Nanoarchaeia archaeon]|nr:DUF350 domain-containing protein [Candidatus Nanoarchaeia archaeon]
MAWELFLIKLGELTISLMVAVLSVVLSIKVFDKLTHGVDEWAELKKGNMAVALVVSSMIISISIMVTLLFSM